METRSYSDVSAKGMQSWKDKQVNGRSVVILMAEDDDDDCLIFREALIESALNHDLQCFKNGQQLMDYLQRRGAYADEDSPQADLIILDLNMPVKDGRTVLQEIKKDSQLKDIPVMVLTESKEEDDISLCYDLGVETFLSKMEWFEVLVEIVKSSGEYWFDMVSPGRRKTEKFPAGKYPETKGGHKLKN
jgi:CheY-like chemotaxis protein